MIKLASNEILGMIEIKEKGILVHFIKNKQYFGENKLKVN